MVGSPLAALAITYIFTAVYMAAGSPAQIPGSSHATAQESEKVHAGHEVFDKNCQQCHAVFLGQYSFGPDLAGETRKAGHKMTSTEIRTIIENGKGKMPPMKDKVTSTEIDTIIAYIKTL
jgi:mono/diheme cytochrome c family protein